MSKHLPSIWRDPRIEPFELNKLSPMGLHTDDRYLTRDLPSIQREGLWYPIMLCRIDPKLWMREYAPHPDGGTYLLPPVINDDGWIWAVKMGANRWQAAKHLGYDTIDAIMFKHTNDCVKLTIWHRECDPLHNPDCAPYSGAWSYR